MAKATTVTRWQRVQQMLDEAHTVPAVATEYVAPICWRIRPSSTWASVEVGSVPPRP